MKALQGNLVHQDLVDPQAFLEFLLKVTQAMMDQMVTQELQESQGKLVSLDLLDLKVSKARPFMGQKEKVGLMDQMALMVNPEKGATLETLGLKVILAEVDQSLAQQEKQDDEDIQVPLECQVWMVSKVFQVWSVTKELTAYFAPMVMRH